MTNKPFYIALAVMLAPAAWWLGTLIADMIRIAADMACTLFEDAVEDSDPWKDRD